MMGILGDVITGKGDNYSTMEDSMALSKVFDFNSNDAPDDDEDHDEDHGKEEEEEEEKKKPRRRRSTGKRLASVNEDCEDDDIEEDTASESCTSGEYSSKEKSHNGPGKKRGPSRTKNCNKKNRHPRGDDKVRGGGGGRPTMVRRNSFGSIRDLNHVHNKPQQEDKKASDDSIGTDIYNVFDYSMTAASVPKSNPFEEFTKDDAAAKRQANNRASLEARTGHFSKEARAAARRRVSQMAAVRSTRNNNTGSGGSGRRPTLVRRNSFGSIRDLNHVHKPEDDDYDEQEEPQKEDDDCQKTLDDLKKGTIDTHGKTPAEGRNDDHIVTKSPHSNRRASRRRPSGAAYSKSPHSKSPGGTSIRARRTSGTTRPTLSTDALEKSNSCHSKSPHHSKSPGRNSLRAARRASLGGTLGMPRPTLSTDALEKSNSCHSKNPHHSKSPSRNSIRSARRASLGDKAHPTLSTDAIEDEQQEKAPRHLSNSCHSKSPHHGRSPGRNSLGAVRRGSAAGTTDPTLCTDALEDDQVERGLRSSCHNKSPGSRKSIRIRRTSSLGTDALEDDQVERGLRSSCHNKSPGSRKSIRIRRTSSLGMGNDGRVHHPRDSLSGSTHREQRNRMRRDSLSGSTHRERNKMRSRGDNLASGSTHREGTRNRIKRRNTVGETQIENAMDKQALEAAAKDDLTEQRAAKLQHLQYEFQRATIPQDIANELSAALMETQQSKGMFETLGSAGKRLSDAFSLATEKQT